VSIKNCRSETAGGKILLSLDSIEDIILPKDVPLVILQPDNLYR